MPLALNPRWRASRVARSIGSRYVPPKYRLAALARRSKVNPYTGSSRDRDKLRRWQDVLIKRAQSQGLNDDARLSVDDPGSPTLRDMRQYIFPAYYDIIERMANERQNPVAPKAFARIMDLEAQRAAASSDPERYYAIQREQDEYEDRYGWPYRASGEQLAYWREWKRGQRNPSPYADAPALAGTLTAMQRWRNEARGATTQQLQRLVQTARSQRRLDLADSMRTRIAEEELVRRRNPIVTDTDLLGRQHARLSGPSGKGRTTGALFGATHQLTAKEKQEQEDLLAWRARRAKEKAEGQMSLFAENPRAAVYWRIVEKDSGIQVGLIPATTRAIARRRWLARKWPKAGTAYRLERTSRTRYNPRNRRKVKRKCIRICRWRNKRGRFVSKGKRR